MGDKKIPKSIPVYLDVTSKEDIELYEALRLAVFNDRDLSMSIIFKQGARKIIKKLGYIRNKKHAKS